LEPVAVVKTQSIKDQQANQTKPKPPEISLPAAIPRNMASVDQPLFASARIVSMGRFQILSEYRFQPFQVKISRRLLSRYCYCY
jgi:hypothetical protein